MTARLISVRHARVAEPFKFKLGRPEVAWLAEQLARVSPTFDSGLFLAAALDGLDDLELKARARHVADALETTLPDEPGEAFAVLVAMMDAPLHETEGYGGTVFRYFPVSEYLERHGLRDVDAALAANYALTQRFSSEFCIRPLILDGWEPTLRALNAWVTDPNPHVRRLVSEGTRPRLPWGRKLSPFILDPSPTLPLLDQLKDDASPYVRRSVANHLNDIAKDNPTVALDVAHAWLPEASQARRRIVEHGLRTLLKRGDTRALELLGNAPTNALVARGELSHRTANLGDTLTLRAILENQGRTPVSALVEARVHFARPSGKASVKPFRVGRVTVAPGASATLEKMLPLVHRSIRKLHPGAHVVELQVNGTRSPMGVFVLAL